jgi:hypothetical protein
MNVVFQPRTAAPATASVGAVYLHGGAMSDKDKADMTEMR